MRLPWAALKGPLKSNPIQQGAIRRQQAQGPKKAGIKTWLSKPGTDRPSAPTLGTTCGPYFGSKHGMPLCGGGFPRSHQKPPADRKFACGGSALPPMDKPPSGRGPGRAWMGGVCLLSGVRCCAHWSCNRAASCVPFGCPSNKRSSSSAYCCSPSACLHGSRTGTRHHWLICSTCARENLEHC